VKVVCLCNKSWEILPLTVGKMYDVIETINIPFSKSRIDDPSGPFYKIQSDNSMEKYFETNRFRELNLDEKRNLKLKDILNE
jgi:hypothetical protein